MDEDAKALLAILALVYGSSNGLGLFKASLQTPETKASELDTAMKDQNAAPSFLKKREKALFRSLWSPRVVVYVALVILVPLFLALVVWKGPAAALTQIGLNSGPSAATTAKASVFYWILLFLTLLASFEYLSTYLHGWRLLAQSWFRRHRKKGSP